MEKIKFTISLVFLPVFFVASMGTYLPGKNPEISVNRIDIPGLRLSDHIPVVRDFSRAA
ncbi:MAG TPA: hypothetical protein VJ936_04990 [Desulfobacteraceae bacterium]|nr:hypothetical protein [Desulfobacteraceae bacterium]